MPYALDLRHIPPKKIFPLGKNFSGTSPRGKTISFTNVSMMVDDQPFFGISGEIHFARVAEDAWEDTLLKAKMGGINIVSTYVFWNAHEEVEGKFRWDGNRNLKKFVQLCDKHGLYVILRVGPFAHGEMRNGGLPDWLYGKPYEVRNRNEGFYGAVRKFYRAINQQTDGLYFRQGGPIIGIQLDNEYMHSAAPWEITTGISNEWVTGGNGGEDYLRDLKTILREEGLITPLYTCTAWGGAMVPTEEALPLWGGYAYWPWIFYGGRKGGHPATPEYAYRDNHNSAVRKTYNFEPRFDPEAYPYACCEIMGGMACSYHYRFILPFESVDALANIKIGSGCNMLGYYMYAGGTHPRGETTPFLNEGQMPRLSYDYQAAIGEYGQIRPSYHRLRLLHYGCQCFCAELSNTKVVLPEFMASLAPTDTEHLRYSVRLAGDSGFVLLNNFQDHAELPARHDESITLALPQGPLTIAGIDLAGGENAILPFQQDLNGVRLRYATAQPITSMNIGSENVWFFFAPAGMVPRYAFDAATVQSLNGSGKVTKGTDEITCQPLPNEISDFTVEGKSGRIRIVTLPRSESLKFYRLELPQGPAAFLSDAPLLWDGETLRVETTAEKVGLAACPASALDALCKNKKCVENGIFGTCVLDVSAETAQSTLLQPKQVGPSRYLLDIPPEALAGHKKVLLQIRYTGDIGHAFIDGEMIGDNFCNGDIWSVRLDDHAEALRTHPLTIYITPVKEDATVNVDSPMAARMENMTGIKAGLDSAFLQPVNEIVIS